MHRPMDIPATGAVFTLGKSYLADNIGTVRHRQLTPLTGGGGQTTAQNGHHHSNGNQLQPPAPTNGRQSPDPARNGALSPVPTQQSYFFIKNDPVVKILCGSKQSAVICESGRLFVWGHNQHGQLGIGSTDLCQKPSCVRTMKKLQQVVLDAKFGGNGFSLILTLDGKLFYSGKSIFPFNARVASLKESGRMKKKSEDNAEFTHVPVELKEFSYCLEKEDEQVVDIAAGFCHFVARTSAGNCFGWGHNSHQQLGGVDSLKILTKPDRIGVEERVEMVACGNYCTLMVSETNKLYLAGKFQKITIPVVKELSMVKLPAKVVSAQITKNDMIYLLLENNQVYRSNRVFKIDDLKLERYLLNQLLRKDECIMQISPANNFTSFLTNEGRLLTTYETDSPFTPSDHFRELTKFKDFTVARMASGLEHSLVLAFPRKLRTPGIDLDFSKAVQKIEAAIEGQKIRNATPMPPLTDDEEFLRQEKRRLRQERIASELSKDESIQIETDADEVRFIDNGVDITTTVLICTENGNGEDNEDAFDVGGNRFDPKYISHMEILDERAMLGKTPTPNISQLIDYSDDGDGSISSQSTFNDEEDATEPYGTQGKNDSNNNREQDRKTSQESKTSQASSGRSSEKMKKFLKDLKAKSMDVSCRNAGTVLNDDTKYSKDDTAIRSVDRDSKVCNVM
ncbi:uncharacterized protein LOC120415809 [Culex pipiens pallens]|uniref:uncharacterized protein LOC120415809 n=1 Tax=Culex pipiens pallens TaxID=42434 RepID=UPI001952CF3A|nr:uncharacterized protein LOC120415809 [Culex pipiens pallens]